MLKKILENLSMVSTRNRSKHRLRWLDKEKQIYDETSSKYFELRFLGIRMWHSNNDVDTVHKVMEKGKAVGFQFDDKDR